MDNAYYTIALVLSYKMLLFPITLLYSFYDKKHRSTNNMMTYLCTTTCHFFLDLIKTKWGKNILTYMVLVVPFITDLNHGFSMPV